MGTEGGKGVMFLWGEAWCLSKPVKRKRSRTTRQELINFAQIKMIMFLTLLSAQWLNLPTDAGLVNKPGVTSSWTLHVEHPYIWERQKGSWWQDTPALLHNCICNLNLFNCRRELKSQASCSLLLCSETPCLSFWTVTRSPVEILL